MLTYVIILCQHTIQHRMLLFCACQLAEGHVINSLRDDLHTHLGHIVHAFVLPELHLKYLLLLTIFLRTLCGMMEDTRNSGGLQWKHSIGIHPYENHSKPALDYYGYLCFGRHRCPFHCREQRDTGSPPVTGNRKQNSNRGDATWKHSYLISSADSVGFFIYFRKHRPWQNN